MGYSESDSMVRVSIFKPSGKWTGDIAVDMGDWYNTPDIYYAIANSIECSGYRLNGDYFYVCLEPYHKNAHPVMFKGKDYK